MHEVLRALSADSFVLDFGCATGSFPPSATNACVVRLDLAGRPGGHGRCHFVQGDGAALPFRSGQFAAVIANHSMEHVDRLQEVLREVGRVLRPDGALYIAVPDVCTVTDRLYRWLARGGGHVNGFRSPIALAAVVERETGLPYVATRVLCSSLSFLNRKNAAQPRRALVIGGGCERSLFLYAWLSRRLDRVLGTRSSVYGWALYFGKLAEPVGSQTWLNVCIGCGAGHSALSLDEANGVRQGVLGVRRFQCPACRTINPFADDEWGSTWLNRELER